MNVAIPLEVEFQNEPKCDVELESNLIIDVINISYNDENHENLQRTRAR